MGKTWKRNTDDDSQVWTILSRNVERSHKQQEQVSHMREDTHRDTPAKQRKALRRIARGLMALALLMTLAHTARAWGSHSGGSSGWHHSRSGGTGSSGGMHSYMHGG